MERYNHDMQEMRGLLGREQVIALSARAAGNTENAPQDAIPVPPRDDDPREASETLRSGKERPWWRRVFGGE